MPPTLLLAFTFALGAGVAVQQPSWGSLIPELVPRTQLRAASRLDLVNVNLSRAVGPALAGLIIAHLGGVPLVFALNALSVVFLASGLLFWRRPRPKAEGPRERFVQALRAGGRYVWHEPVVRRIMLRAILFVAPAMALWALLPLPAQQPRSRPALGRPTLPHARCARGARRVVRVVARQRRVHGSAAAERWPRRGQRSA